MDTVKCNNCKGTGHVPTEHGDKRYTVCPICHGTGKKIVKNKGGNKHGHNQTSRCSK